MKKRLLALLLTFALALSIPVFGSTSAMAKEPDDFIKDIPYIDDGNKFHMLNLHGTDDSGENKPVIVEVHGGSYIGGVKDINTKHSRYYAEHGFAVVNTNYTTMSSGGIDNVVKDLNAALLWVDAQR